MVIAPLRPVSHAPPEVINSDNESLSTPFVASNGIAAPVLPSKVAKASLVIVLLTSTEI